MAVAGAQSQSQGHGAHGHGGGDAYPEKRAPVHSVAISAVAAAGLLAGFAQPRFGHDVACAWLLAIAHFILSFSECATAGKAASALASKAVNLA